MRVILTTVILTPILGILLTPIPVRLLRIVAVVVEIAVVVAINIHERALVVKRTSR
jgi:hypothetical protein